MKPKNYEVVQKHARASVLTRASDFVSFSSVTRQLFALLCVNTRSDADK